MRTLLGLALILLVSCSTPPKLTVTGDAAVTGRTINYWRDADRFHYGTFDDLKDELGKLPPPPTKIRIIRGTAGTPPATLNPNVYSPLLAFVQAGPGGSQITLADLQQITPTAIALYQYYLSNPNMTFTQLVTSPQGGAFLAVAQSILQPLGLWNYNTLNSWSYYVGSQLGTLQTILLNLYNQLIAPLSPGTPGTPDQIIVTAINPLAVIQEIDGLYRSKDWLLFAEKVPGLAYQLIKHVGFSFPRIVLYGSRSRYYAPGVITTRRTDGKRTVYGLNQDGFFINDQASGPGVFYQGADDLSLVYAPIEVRNGKVVTLDLIASDRYALLKRATGGDLRLLERASSFSTGMLKADVAFGKHHNVHLSPVAGVTPFASTGGIAGAVDYEAGYFSGRVGGGVFLENSLNSDVDSLIGYLETENTLQTPKLKIKDAEKTVPELKVWGSATLALAGMATRAVSPVTRSGEEVDQEWGGQGDARLIPEAHVSLDTPIAEFSLYSGFTAAVVPYGTVNLNVPHRSLHPYPIRWHVGGEIRLRLSTIHRYAKEQWEGKENDVEDGVKEWWTKEEKTAQRAKNYKPEPLEWIHLSITAVGEFSKLFHKARFGAAVEAFDAALGFLTELESYLDERFHDVRVGGGASYKGLYARGLKSLKDDDYRLDIGFEVIF